MRINHNIAAMNTYNKLTANTAATAKSLEKLSSGLKINRAGDNAAGLAISEKMRAQVRGLDQANVNAQDSVSLIQTAEGALTETHSILQRMRELAVQSANDTNTSADRNEIQKEVTQLASEIDRIADTTQFNSKVLLKGAYGTAASSDNATNLAVVSAKDDSITAGTFAVNVATLATKTTNTSNAGIDLTGAGVAITAANDTLNINGVDIEFNQGNINQAAFISRINEFSSQTNVLAAVSGTGIVLTDQRFGDHSMSVTGSAETTLFGVQTYTAGVNASISTVDGAAVTVSADATDGSKLTINTGALQGMVLQAATATGVTNIAVTKNSLTMQIGANESQTFNMSIEDMGATSLGVNGIDVSTASAASTAITTIQTAIDAVSSERAKLGAYQNRLEHTSANLTTSSENLTAAESRVRDVDMAKEMMEFQKNNILNQASTAMLAQANQQPQGVLQLLQ